MISNCGSDENGKYTGGQAGDQTGKEWRVIPWFNRPWKCVLRHPNASVRAKLAELATKAANNNNVGYDQSGRGTYWTQLQRAGYDPSKILVACEADCSSGIVANVRAVGYLLGVNSLKNVSATYTGNMRAGLKAAGFTVLTESKYLTSDLYLLEGDILLNDNAHAATNITNGSKSGDNMTTDKKSLDEIAREVFIGKWGNGVARKEALTAAGYDYTAVQAKVDVLVKENQTQTSKPTTIIYGKTSETNADAIWSFLMDKIGNAYGVAGLMGNLDAESALKSMNLQNSYERSLGFTDESYTDAVDNGSYKNFVRDAAGYGLAQWTWWSRKEALLKYCQSKKASIGNLTAQLEFLYKELSETYSGVLRTLKNAKSVLEASNAVLINFERPADMGTKTQNVRASFGQTYYNRYAGSSNNQTITPKPEEKPVTKPTQDVINISKIDPAISFDRTYRKGKEFKTTADLNFRIGAGTNKARIRVLAKGEAVIWYGYYTRVLDTDWYLIVDKNGQTGFVSSKYLS